ncbi:conserved hypothetical protein [Staphylococcus aureus subsp. aureus str. Newman]|uniref:Uncharacterized protein n=1 Tax=Staphylococcus aureus (strain Newman) TaxID=426430 RepID=A0A0H3K7I2_STAAE|nr:hypothetical protein B6175_04060 [Staphylococcus aureus]EEV27266.1 conserved hypothetical protein [Staphylococcus aureus A9781]EFG44613.1 hypothetical protein SMAG_01609 [Staphylococcus aureus A8819]EFH37091.1 hypothetical protein SLAG_01263 [Staphylococcus aureus A8796]BAF66966.1 conserved hypothetical protein [Staphylococcus aureus subsp. aureus str. Newman]
MLGPTPTCIVCRNWRSNFSMLGPRQLALSVEIGNPISLCWGPAVNYCQYSVVVSKT